MSSWFWLSWFHRSRTSRKRSAPYVWLPCVFTALPLIPGLHAGRSLPIGTVGGGSGGSRIPQIAHGSLWKTSAGLLGFSGDSAFVTIAGIAQTQRMSPTFLLQKTLPDFRLAFVCGLKNKAWPLVCSELKLSPPPHTHTARLKPWCQAVDTSLYEWGPFWSPVINTMLYLRDSNSDIKANYKF